MCARDDRPHRARAPVANCGDPRETDEGRGPQAEPGRTRTKGDRQSALGTAATPVHPPHRGLCDAGRIELSTLVLAGVDLATSGNSAAARERGLALGQRYAHIGERHNRSAVEALARETVNYDFTLNPALARGERLVRISPQASRT